MAFMSTYLFTSLIFLWGALKQLNQTTGVKIPSENQMENADRGDDMYICTAFFIFWGIRGDDNLQSMLVGAVMRKIKSRTWKKQRYFKLQDDGMTIWYKSKKAGNTHSTCKDT